MPAACTRCQAALAENELEGLCPRCLLEQALPLEWAGGAPTTPPGGFVPPAPAELAPLFGQLEVLELLGQGGMGAVYKARQVKLDRLVALKVLPPAAAQGPGFAERFAREARALARLSHPHVVAVYDFGEVQGLYYLMMEYVDGVNLRQAMAEGKLSPPQALALVGQLCSALQYAHEMGVVHRDVKPENVLLDRQGRVKVADFGLAKLVGPAQAGRLTATAQAMGTPHYMAPEQWERPLEVDHRADIYSLGVVFYELLTGELPLGKFAPPSAKSGVDARLDGVVLRAMEKQPEQRYQQMSEMKSAVEAVEQEAPEEEEPEEAPEEEEGDKPLRRELDVLATIGMVGLAAAVWAALVWAWPWVNQEKLRSYGLFAVCLLMPWGFAAAQNRYLRRLWAVAVLTVCLSGVWCELVGAVHPLGLGGCLAWALCLVFGPWAVSAFVASFKPGEGGEEEESDEDEDEEAPVPGLTEQEENLRVLLEESADDFHSMITALPEIESEALAEARKACQVPPDDRVIGMLALGVEDWRSVLVFGCQGLYWRNADGTPHSGGGAMNYVELGRRRFVNHGDAVYLGRDQYICPNEAETCVTAEQLTGLLYQVREVFEAGDE
jgi:serine/threonine protein kinase